MLETIKRDHPFVYDMILEDGTISVPVPVEVRTHGDLVLSFDGKEEYRPEDQLTYEAIDRLRKSGPVVFAMEMKRARLLSVFSDGRYVIESPDKELAEVATAGLRQVMPRIANDFTYSAFVYGVSFQEQVWERRTKYELGISDSRSGTSEFVVPKVFQPVSPMSVTKIFRKDGHYDGFEQQPLSVTSQEKIRVEAHQSLVIPYREEFRRLWGPSFLEPLYPLWITYERVLRAMIRYMDRMAVPIAVVKAPSKGYTEIPGSTTRVKNLQYALTLAMSLAKSNAVAIPSEVDENGVPLWTVEYLTAESRQQSFIDVLEFLTQEMVRAALSADRSLSQSSGGVGSYNIGEIHAEASSAAAEMLLINFVYYINRYFMPYFGLYNRGPKSPPIYIKTQPVTTREQQILMTLLQQGSGSPAGVDFFNSVDWRGLAEVSNIPILAEGEEFKPPKPPKSVAPAQVVEDPAKIPEAEKKALEGGYLVLSYDDILNALVKKNDTITLARPSGSGFDEAMVMRDQGGKFAKKKGSKMSPEDDARRQGIINSLDQALAAGQITQEEYDNLLKLTDFHFQLKDKLETPEDVRKMLEKDFGYKGTINIVDEVSRNPIAELMTNGEIVAYYDWGGGEMTVSQSTMDSLIDGNLEAYQVLVHEAVHSKQGAADRLLAPGEMMVFGNILTLADLNPITSSRRVGHQEGINQLFALRSMSDKIGVPVNNNTMATASKMISDSRYSGAELGEVYIDETRYAASVVVDLATKSGTSEVDVLRDLHLHALDFPYQQDKINEVYGSWLGTWPSSEDYNEAMGHDRQAGEDNIAKVLN